MYDPPVYGTATDAMQTLLRAVSTGYVYYVCGTVEASAAAALAHKFHERYCLTANTNQRYHRQKKGISKHWLVMTPKHESTAYHWWLLRSEGVHPLDSLERWSDARKVAIQWPWYYELVRLSVPKKHREKLQGKKPRPIKPVMWTWRIRPTEIIDLQATIRHLVHQSDGRLAGLVRGLGRAPGFRGVRQDAASLIRYVETQCRKQGREPPEVPVTLRWVTYRELKTVPLSNDMKKRNKNPHKH